jgi:type III secretion system FlhB-like substrate exporter
VSFIYTPAKQKMAKGDADFDTLDVRALLVMSNTTADTDQDAASLSAIGTLDEYDGSGYSRPDLGATTITQELVGHIQVHAKGYQASPELGSVVKHPREIEAVLQRALPVAVAIGAADYAYQRWSMSEQMKMSKQDVKQEMKEQDGDPLFKARRRQLARQIAFSRQIADVQKADVVLTNPTHYAIALRYRKEEAAAPIVLARGVDALAMKIRAEASRHDVPTVENRPLARALYAKAKVGRPIPKDFFGPVAQVLAVVYKRRAARKTQR